MSSSKSGAWMTLGETWKIAASILAAATFLSGNSPAQAPTPAPPATAAEASPGNDRILCTDGTVVVGRIVAESPDEVTILTRRGQFTYQRVDVRSVEREAPKAGPTPTPAPTPNFDINRVLPAGPINPMAPPRLPAIHQFALSAMRQKLAELLAATPPAPPPDAGTAPSADATPAPTPGQF